MNIEEAKEEVLKELIGVEGGYTNNKYDSGGKTKYGITEAVARANGYKGDMKDLPLSFAKKIYKKRYLNRVRFDKVAKLSLPIAKELVDIAVNMYWLAANKYLQRALNLLNKRGKYYDDLIVDGKIGKKTLAALEKFLKIRGEEGEKVLLKMLNAMQGGKYIALAERREKDEEFIYGWFKNRVKL